MIDLGVVVVAAIAWAVASDPASIRVKIKTMANPNPMHRAAASSNCIRTAMASCGIRKIIISGNEPIRLCPAR